MSVLAPTGIGVPIDLAKDFALNALEKLSYEAHSRKIILGLWESPAPSCVAPTTRSKVSDWDARPMEVNYRRPETKVRRFKGMPISVKTSFRPTDKSMSFHGYKSEPPAAKLFKEDLPIGPAAGAIKAAGELVAIARERKFDEKVILDLFKAIWGVDISKLTEYIVPDLSGSSLKDLIKFARGSTHTICGFSDQAPSVTINMASYRSETLAKAVYVDWHRISLCMRWIGEYNARYNPENRDQLIKYGVKQLFTPVLGNMPREEIFTVLEDATWDFKLEENTAITKIAEQTVKYYQGTINDYAVLSNLKSRGLIVSEVNPDEFNTIAIRELIDQPANKVSRIRLARENVREDYLDIYKDVNTPPAPMTRISKLKFSHHYSGKGALKTILEALLTNYRHTLYFSEIRGLLTAKKEYDKFGLEKYEKVAKKLLEFLPSNTGDLVYALLRFTTSTDEEAQSKFIEVIKSICPNNANYALSSKSSIFIQAIRQSRDLSWLLDALGGAFRLFSDSQQSARGIVFKPVPGGSPHDIILDALEEFAIRKLKFWFYHYRSRVSYYVNKLKVNKSSSKRDVWKRNVIIYSGLRQAYCSFQVICRGGFQVYLEHNVKNWIDWACRTIEVYRKKRESRKNRKPHKLKYVKRGCIDTRTDADDESFVSEEEKDELLRAKNLISLFNSLDNFLKPKYKFVDLLREIDRRRKMTMGSIGVTFRYRLASDYTPSKVVSDEIINDDMVNMLSSLYNTTPMMVTFDYTDIREDPAEDKGQYDLEPKPNPLDFSHAGKYDALAYSDSSDDDDSESVSSEEAEYEEKAEFVNVTEEEEVHEPDKDEALMDYGMAQDLNAEEEDPEAAALMAMLFGYGGADEQAEVLVKTVINLHETLRTEFGMGCSVHAVADALGLTVNEVENYDTQGDFHQLKDLYEKVARHVTSSGDENFLESNERFEENVRDII